MVAKGWVARVSIEGHGASDPGLGSSFSHTRRKYSEDICVLVSFVWELGVSLALCGSVFVGVGICFGAGCYCYCYTARVLPSPPLLSFS